MLKDIVEGGNTKTLKGELECSICLGFVMDSAQECGQCARICCNECILNGGVANCPTCTTGTFKPLNRLVKMMI